MTIEKVKDGDKLTVKLGGRLDTNTSIELDKALKESTDGVKSMEVDLSELVYVSSAGIRILLGAYKAMNGNLTVTNVQDAVMEIFETTGLAAALNIG